MQNLAKRIGSLLLAIIIALLSINLVPIEVKAAPELQEYIDVDNLGGTTNFWDKDDILYWIGKSRLKTVDLFGNLPQNKYHFYDGEPQNSSEEEEPTPINLRTYIEEHMLFFNPKNKGSAYTTQEGMITPYIPEVTKDNVIFLSYTANMNKSNYNEILEAVSVVYFEGEDIKVFQLFTYIQSNDDCNAWIATDTLNPQGDLDLGDIFTGNKHGQTKISAEEITTENDGIWYNSDYKFYRSYSNPVRGDASKIFDIFYSDDACAWADEYGNTKYDPPIRPDAYGNVFFKLTSEDQGQTKKFGIALTDVGNSFLYGTNLEAKSGTLTVAGFDRDTFTQPDVDCAVGDHPQIQQLLRIYSSLWDDVNIRNELHNIKGDTPLINFIREVAGYFETDAKPESLFYDEVLPSGIFDTYHAVQIVMTRAIDKTTSNEKVDEGITIFTKQGSSIDNKISIKLTKNSGGSLDLEIEEGEPLTPYQHDSLVKCYTEMVSLLSNNIPANNISNYILKTSNIKGATAEYETCGNNDLQLTFDKEDLMRKIEEFNTYEFTPSTQAVLDVARLSSTIAEYNLFHATSTNLNLGSEDYNLDDLTTYDAKLDALCKSWNMLGGNELDAMKDARNNPTNTGSTSDYPFQLLPSEVSAIDAQYDPLLSDSQNKDLGFSSIILDLYAISFTFNAIQFSQYGINQGYTYENLEAYLSGNPTAELKNSASYQNMTQALLWLESCKEGDNYSQQKLAEVYISEDTNAPFVFRCIIELHKTCELLGIKPEHWSQTIYNYNKLYLDHREVFEALEDNACVYGVGYNGAVNLRNPLGKFFSVHSTEMSEDWNIGYSLSSLYVPMVTNLYDVSTYDYIMDLNPEWITDYLYRYGFFRKALYISTDPNIIVNKAQSVASTNGKTIAKLSDLLNYDRDIELYVDDDFYNADQIADAIGKVDYATLFQYTHTKKQELDVTDTAAEDQQKSEYGTNVTIDDAKNYIDETLNLDTNTLLKDEDMTSYSTDIAKDVTKLMDTKESETKSLYDGYILSADAITKDDGVFYLYDYSPMVSYGVISAIYRDVEIFNAVSSVSSEECIVFKSSKNILYAPNTNKTDWVAYMNYLQLANLEKQMSMNVETQLDLDSPIFIDLFGNIVTESGYVVIPAASNPTLSVKGDQLNWNPYTMGFGTLLSNGAANIDPTEIPTIVSDWLCSNGGSITTEINGEEIKAENVKTLGSGAQGGWFIINRNNNIQLKNVQLVSNGVRAYVNWSALNTHADAVQQVFWNNAYYSKAMKMYSSRIVNMVVEVLRGAPVEYIDYEKEGIKPVSDSSIGIVVAYALDNIIRTVSSKSKDYINSLVTMPNMAFMPYLKYVIYFGVKITIALLIVVFLIRLFMNGVKNKFGFKNVLEFVFTTIVVVSAIYILPNSIIWSYDKANSVLLNSEAADILLYSQLRDNEGQEIGITEVKPIDENTQLLMQIDTVSPSWSQILGTALLGGEYNSFTELFDDAMKDTPYYNMPGVTNKGTAVYIDANTILNSTRVSYNRKNNMLTNKVMVDTGTYIKPSRVTNENTTNNSEESGVESTERIATEFKEESPEGGYYDTDYYSIYSFTSPYYVILDQLIANINEYNSSHDIQTYTAGITSKGGVITYDVIAPYLTSDEFQVDGYDILGLTDALQCEVTLPKYAYIFDEKEKAAMEMSAWYPDPEMSEETKHDRINEIYEYTRAYVANHYSVLKHLPDQTLIKVIAFVASVEYNKVFHCQYANSIKLINVDNRDFMRFMTANFDGIYKNYAYTFGRSVLNTSGTAGVILSAILSVIILISSVLKPVLTMILFVIIIINICFRHILLDKPNKGVEGYFIGCALFMILNFTYAGLLKVSFLVANTDVTPITSMVLCIVIQILYLLGLVFLIYTQISDWKNSGYMHYAKGMGYILAATGRSGSNTFADINKRTNNYNDEQPNTLDMRLHKPKDAVEVYVTDKPKSRGNRTTFNGRRTISQMHERDEERESSPYRKL